MRSKRPKKGILIKKRKILMPILIAITFSLFILIWIYPMFIGYNWAALLVWQPYSLVTALISLAVLSTSVTWFVWQGSK